MTQLCFATFAKALQKVLIQPAATYNTPTRTAAKKPSKARPKMTSTDTYVVEVRLRWIQDVHPIADKDQAEVWRTSKTVSDLMNQKIELHTGFGEALIDKEVSRAAVRQFSKLKPQIAQMRKEDFTAELAHLIKDDPEISVKETERLLTLADRNDEEFWAETFMSAISRPNKERDDPESSIEGLLLAARNSDLCPLCGKEKLIAQVKGKRVPQFDVVTFNVDDEGENTAREVVCLKCAKRVGSSNALFHDEEVLAKLRAAYRRKQAAIALQDAALEAQIHPAIAEIIETLGDKILNGGSTPLTLKAVPVANKIRIEFYELSQRILILVLQWYRIIEQLFRDLEDKHRNRFTVIATQVADFYEQASRATDDQQEIFEAVARWIHANSNSSNLNASFIVAAFFCAELRGIR